MNYYKRYTPYLFLLPATAVLLVFFFIPFFQTIGLSFFDYSTSLYNPTFNGIDNYIKLFSEPIFYKVMFNTFMYLVIAVPFLVTFPLFIAILINQKIRGITLYKILIYLPVIVSIVVAAIAFKWLYAGQGVLNYLLSIFHIEPIGSTLKKLQNIKAKDKPFALILKNSPQCRYLKLFVGKLYEKIVNINNFKGFSLIDSYKYYKYCSVKNLKVVKNNPFFLSLS